MISRLIHIRKLFLLLTIILLSAGILSSCIYEDYSSLSNQAEKNSDIFVSFLISLGDDSSTKASLTEEIGSQSENRIDPGNFMILLFEENDAGVRLKEILYQNASPAPGVGFNPLGYGEYYVTAKLNSLTYTGRERFSIVVIANWNSLQETELNMEIGTTTLQSVLEKTYLLNSDPPGESATTESWIPDNESFIPMFGLYHASLEGYSSALYNEANPMEMGVVNLLRALVKIEVIDNSRSEDYDILGISLNERNTRGYLAPLLRNGENTRQVISPSVPSSMEINNPAATSSRKLRFRKDGNRYVAYVPEFILSEEKSLESRGLIDVEIAYRGTTETRQIYLAPYRPEGNPYVPQGDWDNEWKALLRNHIYRFTINSINIDPNLNIVADVQPFSFVTLSQDLGLERTEDGYIVVRDRTGNIVKYIRTDDSVLTLESDYSWPEIGRFTGVFDSWKRILLGYLDDGRTVFFNYLNDEPTQSEITSWAIYSISTPDTPSIIEEEFTFIESRSLSDSNEIITPPFTHSIFDDKGRLISRMTFTSREHFQAYCVDPRSCSPPFVSVSYIGLRFGDKIIRYHDADGNIYCRIIVEEGKEDIYQY